MLYLIIVVALWRVLRRWRARCRALPYQPPSVEYSVMDYIPQTTTQAEQDSIEDSTPDYWTAAELERLEVLKAEYMNVLDAIEQEQADLRAEYEGASVKRRSQISSKQTTLANRHATVTSKLNGIEAKAEKLYNQNH